MPALRYFLFPVGIIMVAFFAGIHVNFAFANRFLGELDPITNAVLFVLWVLGVLGLAATIYPPVDWKLVRYYGVALALLSAIWAVHAYRGELPRLRWEVPFLIAMTIGPVGTGLILVRLPWRTRASPATA